MGRIILFSAAGNLSALIISSAVETLIISSVLESKQTSRASSSWGAPIGSRLIVALPDREVDLGRVDPEARVIVLREQGWPDRFTTSRSATFVAPSSQAAGIGSLESRAGMN